MGMCSLLRRSVLTLSLHDELQTRAVLVVMYSRIVASFAMYLLEFQPCPFSLCRQRGQATCRVGELQTYLDARLHELAFHPVLTMASASKQIHGRCRCDTVQCLRSLLVGGRLQGWRADVRIAGSSTRSEQDGNRQVMQHGQPGVT